MLRSAFLNAVLTDVGEFSIISRKQINKREYCVFFSIIILLLFHSILPTKSWRYIHSWCNLFWKSSSRAVHIPFFEASLAAGWGTSGWMQMGESQTRRPCLRRPPNRSTLRFPSDKKRWVPAARSQGVCFLGSCVKIYVVYCNMSHPWKKVSTLSKSWKGNGKWMIFHDFGVFLWCFTRNLGETHEGFSILPAKVAVEASPAVSGDSGWLRSQPKIRIWPYDARFFI